MKAKARTAFTLIVLWGTLPQGAWASTVPVAAPVADPGAIQNETPSGPPRRETRGLDVSLGLGAPYAYYGVQTRYDFVLRPWLHLSPLVAVGLWRSRMTTAAGVSVILGHRSRLAIDAVIAPTGNDALNLHGSTVDSRIFYGPNFAAGYEFMNDEGHFQRITIGYARSLWPGGNGYDSSAIVVGLGFGGRIW